MSSEGARWYRVLKKSHNRKTQGLVCFVLKEKAFDTRLFENREVNTENRIRE